MYSIDTNNLLTTYGLAVSGSDGSLDFLKRKEIDKFDFFDSDGEQYYTTAADLTFEPRTIKLRATLVNSSANHATKLANLTAMLQATGSRSLVTPYSAKAFSVYLKNGAELSYITRLGEVGARMDIELYEHSPNDGLISGDTLPTKGTASESITIDGWDLYRLFGIKVVKRWGNDSLLKQKLFPVFSDPFTTGELIYQDAVNYEARDIYLECVMFGADVATLVTNLRLFKSIIFAAGLRTLVIGGVTHNVYMRDGAAVKFIQPYYYQPTALSFTMKFREPTP